jgi:hypothetical protein
MRPPLSFALFTALSLLSGCTPHRAPGVASAALPPPVTVAGMVREAAPNDYLRVSFLPAGVPVTSLSRPGALRAFVTATPLFTPPLKLADLPAYSGLVNNDANVLVAMRCRPQHPEAVDALLATWPNVFLAIQRDLPLDSSSCTAAPANPSSRSLATPKPSTTCRPHPCPHHWPAPLTTPLCSSTPTMPRSPSGSKTAMASSRPSAAWATPSRIPTTSTPSP